jgi:hypothetical protein
LGVAGLTLGLGIGLMSRISSFADEAREPLSAHRRFLIAWGTLAIYYSNVPWASLRLALAGAFAAFAVWVCWLTARRAMSAVFLVLFAAVVAWWISIAPSHDRPWRPEVAVMPRAIIDGDRVRIMGVRGSNGRCYIRRKVATAMTP